MTNDKKDDKQTIVALTTEGVKRRLLLIICIAIAVSSVFFVAALKKSDDSYEADATFAVSSYSTKDPIRNIAKAGEVAGAFSKILQREEIRKIILQDIGGSRLNGEIFSEPVAETNLIKIRTESGDLFRAYSILNSIVSNQKMLMEYVSDDVDMELLVSPGIGERKFGAVRVARSALVLLAIIIAGGIALTAASCFMKPAVKTPSQIRSMLGAECLGVLPMEKRGRLFSGKANLLISRPSTSFGYAEAVNRLCRKIRNAMHGENGANASVLMVTSAAPNEGKSTIAANIAYSLYESGKEVAIIDLDLMNPSIFKIFGVSERLTGLKDFLNGKPAPNLVRELEDGLCAVLNTERTGYTADMLGSGKLKELLDMLKESFDYVIVDSPPAVSVADAEIIADLTDCSLLAVKQNSAREEAVCDAAAMLRNSGSKFLGCVLNCAAAQTEAGGSDYYSKYKYGYRSYYSDGYYKRDT